MNADDRKMHMHGFGCGRPGACPDQTAKEGMSRNGRVDANSAKIAEIRARAEESRALADDAHPAALAEHLGDASDLGSARALISALSRDVLSLVEVAEAAQDARFALRELASFEGIAPGEARSAEAVRVLALARLEEALTKTPSGVFGGQG